MSSRGSGRLRAVRTTHVAGILAVALLAVGCGAAGRAPGPNGAAGDARLAVSTAGWRTDFARHSVPLGEFMPGGPGRDGIPPIDRPRFLTVSRAARYLDAQEPVLAVEVSGRARAYPQQILIWHEIVNDTLAGRPIAVTYCPCATRRLCSTGGSRAVR